MVCVPHDCEQQKMRVCRYKVIGVDNGGLLPEHNIQKGDIPEAPAPKVEPAQVQGAEPPRGPHKPPAEQPETAKPKEDDFGAGIFD